MAKATQKDRLLSIATPLGDDYLLLNKLRMDERISELFEIDVELLYDEEEDNSYDLTMVDGAQIIGKTVSISITQEDGGERLISGMVNNFTVAGRNRRFTAYYATIVPHVWLLTRVVQSRIFQHQTVPEILRQIFAGFEVKYQLQAAYKPRNYCVQYRESDFAFASRLMEEEGIYYYFEHSGGMEKMILRDDFKSPEDCPSKSEIPIVNEDLKAGEPWESAIKDWQTDFRMQSGKVTNWDYHFQLPKKKLDADKQSMFTVGDNKKLEVYDFPAGCARKYDGIDSGGGERAADLSNIFDDNKRTVSNRMSALDAQYKTISAWSDCATLTSGYRFELKNHPYGEFNKKYIVTSVKHEAEQTPDYVVGDTKPRAYRNTFVCLPHGAGSPEYRPPQKTPKPIVHGSQTAIVVGPAGEEIFTDKYGRVKVQFHWDRHGKYDLNSACWLRVATSVAGNKWGAIFIPRINMEVIVDFLEGDPDQPIITGCVYNPDAMPPYTLPDEKTKSTIKTNSSKGGGGFNELRFEDKKGEEQIFIHGEKDLDVRIKHDRKEIIQNDSHLIVENDQAEHVKGDKHLKIVGNQNEKVDGSVSLNVGRNIDEKTGQNYALDAGMAIHLKAGMSMTLEAGASLTLKVGGNFININPAGVFIKGLMVMINSGGAAGSGAGSSPDAPKQAKEACKADPGDKISNPAPPAPPAPKTFSPEARALKKAARNGSAFAAKDSSAAKNLQKMIQIQQMLTMIMVMNATLAKIKKQKNADDKIITEIARAVAMVKKDADEIIENNAYEKIPEKLSVYTAKAVERVGEMYQEKKKEQREQLQELAVKVINGASETASKIKDNFN